MPANRTAKSALIPVGFQKISLSNSTAVAVNSTCKASNVLDISVETNSARYRADGSAPTLTTGVLLPAGFYRLEGYNGTTALKFQRSTGACVVSIQAYRHNIRSVT